MNRVDIKYLFTVQEHITFSISVVSNEFSGRSNFCISKKDLKKTINILKSMYSNLEGLYKVLDYDSDDYIEFEVLTLGHVRICGQVGGSYNSQYLKYEFQSDQTILREIISIFSSMLDT